MRIVGPEWNDLADICLNIQPVKPNVLCERIFWIYRRPTELLTK